MVARSGDGEERRCNAHPRAIPRAGELTGDQHPAAPIRRHAPDLAGSGRRRVAPDGPDARQGARGRGGQGPDRALRGRGVDRPDRARDLVVAAGQREAADAVRLPDRHRALGALRPGAVGSAERVERPRAGDDPQTERSCGALPLGLGGAALRGVDRGPGRIHDALTSLPDEGDLLLPDARGVGCLASGIGGLRRHGRGEGDVRAPADRVAPRRRAGGAERRRRLLERRRAAQPARRGGPGPAQGARGRDPRRRRLRSARPAGALAAHEDGGGRRRQVDRGLRRSRLRARRIAARGRELREDAAHLGAGRGRAPHLEPGGRPRRRSSRQPRPDAAAEPATARGPRDEPGRLHRAGGVRADLALVAGQAGEAPPRPRRLGLPRRGAGLPLPADLDNGFFNVAPPDQQTDAIRANERVVLENLLRDHPRLVTSLAPVTPARADRAHPRPGAGARDALRHAEHRHRSRHLRAHVAEAAPPGAAGGRQAGRRRDRRGHAVVKSAPRRRGKRHRDTAPSASTSCSPSRSCPSTKAPRSRPSPSSSVTDTLLPGHLFTSELPFAKGAAPEPPSKPVLPFRSPRHPLASAVGATTTSRPSP